ncbi:MAG: MotA/TolQ/ExbB proton channel family protein [Gammaproteobacteria bacterium]|nr:MotA/TolQ/ExbB proton channel family protein [Gammaproteobacteria bacterium]
MAYAVPRISPTDNDAAHPDADKTSEEGARNAEPVSRHSAIPFPEEKDPHRYLLLLRFALLNLVAFGLLGAAYAQGMVHMVVTADRTHLAVVIFFVFLAGLAICAWKVLQTSRELNDVRSYDPKNPSETVRYISPLLDRDAESRANLTGALRMKLSHRISVVRNIANSLVLLGLIGTVLGFIIALSGVDPENASEVSSIAPMVSTLIEGMSTALYTTLVGAVLNVWLMANHHLLAGGTVKLISGLVVLAETNARN